ncbi:MAG: hypothetical protein JWO78_1818 [Micavibrio sp.]|nr:hypothetical protein [Micavibrio sp.]
MYGLEHYTKDQLDLLIKLPYRIGLFVSSSDDTGGDESAEAEMQALSLIVTSFAEDYLKSQFVQTMMEQTVSRRNEWESWGENIEAVPGECFKAIDLLCDYLDRKQVASFKLTMMEIATSVAMAYREFDDNSDISTRIKMYSRVLLDRLRAIMNGNKSFNADEVFNVSDAERRALDKLIESLDLSSTRRQAKYIDPTIDPDEQNTQSA